MMRSFVNNKGEKITVDEKHLEMAVEIKKHLQNASPSRKTSWKLHKQCMEKEGIFDSCVCESYRCMIKSYQKSIGELPSVEKHADMVSDNKLQSIRDLVSDIAYEKRENQLYLREINKGKRELIDFSLVVEEIGNAFRDYEMPKIDSEINVLPKSNREMLVLPSDWHIGLTTDKYNYEVAKDRINRYIDKIIEYASVFEINSIKIAHMGDICENVYMHNFTQAKDVEFNYAEQIVKGTELLYYMISKLSKVLNVVFLGVVSGNHGRFYKKGETLHNDSAEYVVNESIRMMIKMSENPRITIEDKAYECNKILTKVRKYNVKIIHGDGEPQNDREKIQKHMSLENSLIDVLAMGHFHNFQIKTENKGRIVYGSGCLQGSTNFGKSLKYDSQASQGLIIFGENEILPLDIILE